MKTDKSGVRSDCFRVFCLLGSLRAASLNKAALQALKRAAPDDVRVHIFDGLGQLPLFNPDDEHLEVPALRELRQSIRTADVLVFASPEYAHGISGAMKNLLDHLVSGEEFVDKAVALINTSPRATHAQIALREVLQTMSARLVERACVELPLLGSGMTLQQIEQDPHTQRVLTGMLNELRRFSEKDVYR